MKALRRSQTFYFPGFASGYETRVKYNRSAPLADQMVSEDPREHGNDMSIQRAEGLHFPEYGGGGKEWGGGGG